MYYIGEKVKIKNTNFVGVIKNIQVRKNETIFHIDIKGKVIILDNDSIEKTDLDDTKEKNRHSGCYYTYDNDFKPEITIRHQTLDIAMYNVENFVDEAIQNNARTIKIIHGRNGGILRKAVHEYLKHNKNIESFRLGNYYEGSYGVTIVNLKK